MAKRNFSESLGKIVTLLKKDFTDVFTKNPVVPIVLLAIIILPSLYALINIQACWDPYDNTGNIEIAVANLDNGTTFEGESLNVGNEIEDELKGNDDFYWVFVNETELREGVKNGTYYSGIIIPKNFSKSIKSITTDDPHSAELEYIVNRKSNPMASKLSDSAAKAVYNKINAKIVQFINVVAYSKLGELQSALSQGAGQMSSGAVQLSSGSAQVNSGASQVKSGSNQVKSAANQVQSGGAEVQSGSEEIKSHASEVKSGANQVSQGSSQIQSSSQQIQAGSSQVQSSAKQLDSSVDVDKLPSDDLKHVVNSSKQLANASSNLAGSSSQLANGSVQLANGSVQLADGSVQLADGSVRLADGSVRLANGSVQLADGSVQLAEGSLSLAAGSQLLANSAAYALFAASSSLSGAASSLSSITGVDENQIGSYIYSPVTLNEIELNPVDNYGSEVAPFYLVLSMWVGALITCVMLRTGQSTGTEYSPSEMYFGKLLIFMVMAVLETTVTLIGASILGIEMSNPVLFVLSAYFIALVFMLICYSLTSALGQLGKGIAVIWLVFQISGTGGIYPIQLMGPILQAVSPYMPMTHGITLLREAALGLVWSNYIHSFLILIAMGLITLILALIIKVFADKRAHWFEEKLNETDLFH
ncbi:YhgE/Pip-like protein [Methanobrevibacter ruminantium M1]|uniref:YhgE/Pip-like protein n=1 Tax=Methanobrevibacter ruminantium (strain ATCC 35063 / DSM 1093 / JCM 13430 / OCM 146 / M1) TaxID=634498 RepID=D3E499_METRM|nr:YhgE/Pip domain-containing protein [Methanobrevibacter ruminantium]ADC47360.1 YhgE/Pip-like protein [Methanobrevibacter ruminantium M1]